MDMIENIADIVLSGYWPRHRDILSAELRPIARVRGASS
jgi:hypothetical protein